MPSRGYAHTVLLGNLTADVEYKGAQNNVGVFSLAVNKIYNGEEHVSFFDCAVFGKLLDSIGQYLTKGKQVLVEAEPDQNRWQAEDGTNRSKVQFKVRSLQLLGGKNGDEGGQAAGAPQNKPIHRYDLDEFEDDIPI